MGKILKTLVIGAATGAAAAYFLTTKKGKEVTEKVKHTVDDYRDNPEEYHQYAGQKVAEYKDLAVSTFHDYKTKFDSGEVTTDDILASVKDKADQATAYASSKLADIKKGFDENKRAEEVVEIIVPAETTAEVDDIVIAYPEKDMTEEIAD